MAAVFETRSMYLNLGGKMESLCQSCRYVRKITSGKGSVFWLCELAQTDDRFRKYPPQPIVNCIGYEPRDEDHAD